MNPEHIANKEFSTVKKGWNPEEVQAFLDTLAEDIVLLHDENHALRGEIRRLEQQLHQSQSIEKRVRSMLSEMKNASTRMVGQAEASAAAMSYKVEQERKSILEHARSEAELVIRDAERRAERQLIQANGRLQTLKEQIDLLDIKKLALITRIKSILRAQVDFLTALEKGKQTQPGPMSLQRTSKTREGIERDAMEDIIERLDDMETHNV
ncbi:MAG: DivIVA domain-containing protein [Bacteroidetes bacterium]|nr:DivIVA domain-containing protein [Bacteroidota bacterium]